MYKTFGYEVPLFCFTAVMLGKNLLLRRKNLDDDDDDDNDETVH